MGGVGRDPILTFLAGRTSFVARGGRKGQLLGRSNGQRVAPERRSARLGAKERAALVERGVKATHLQR